MHKMGPQGPKDYIFSDQFYSRNAKMLRKYSMYFSILMLENTWYHHFTWSGPNWQEIVNFFRFNSGTRGPTIGTKFTISCEFAPHQVKWWHRMFSSMKKEEYMGSEFSGIFGVNVVAKNTVFGSLGTQHQAVSAVWCLFLKKYTNVLNQTVTLKCFLC